MCRAAVCSVKQRVAGSNCKHKSRVGSQSVDSCIEILGNTEEKDFLFRGFVVMLQRIEKFPFRGTDQLMWERSPRLFLLSVASVEIWISSPVQNATRPPQPLASSSLRRSVGAASARGNGCSRSGILLPAGLKVFMCVKLIN